MPVMVMLPMSDNKHKMSVNPLLAILNTLKSRRKEQLPGMPVMVMLTRTKP